MSIIKMKWSFDRRIFIIVIPILYLFLILIKRTFITEMVTSVYRNERSLWNLTVVWPCLLNVNVKRLFKPIYQPPNIAAIQNLGLLWQHWFYEIIGVYYWYVKIPQCLYVEHRLKYISFYDQIHKALLAICYNSPLVRDKPIGAPHLWNSSILLLERYHPSDAILSRHLNMTKRVLILKSVEKSYAVRPAYLSFENKLQGETHLYCSVKFEQKHSVASYLPNSFHIDIYTLHFHKHKNI